MKKIGILFFMLMLIFSLTSCKKKKKLTPELLLNESNITMNVDEVYQISPTIKNLTGNNLFIVSVDHTDVLSIDGESIKALKAGTAIVTITLKDYQDIFKSFSVTVNEPFVPTLLFETTTYNLVVGDSITLAPTTNASGTNVLTITPSNPSACEITGYSVKALSAGNITLNVSLKDYPTVQATITLNISEPFVPTLSFETTTYNLVVGNSITLTPTTNVSGTNVLTITPSNPSACEITGYSVKALSAGNITLNVSLKDYPTVQATITLTISEPDTTKPEITLVGNTPLEVKLNWGKTFNALDGIKAIDNIDGDITNKITVIGTVDNKSYGKYNIKYEVLDAAGNLGELTRVVEVIWDYAVQFIGHAGSYFGISNTEEAFLYAASVLKYQAIECDVKQTSDGVFVTCHDDTFAGYTLASTTWANIKDVEYTQTRNAGYPSQYGDIAGNGKYTSKICTFDRYLEICKQYNCTPIVELKSSNGITNTSQTRMQALMDAIEKAGMLDKVVFLGSAYNCLIWVKQNGYDYIPCQYLVNSCESEDVLNRCKTYGFDLSINAISDNKNSVEWLARYQDEGIKVSAWTFTQYVDYPELQKWIDYGVDYVTCDWQKMDELVLPENKDLVKHNVMFKDPDGNILKETTVINGRTAAAPTVVPKEGYKFDGWDKSLKNVTEDTIFTAVYSLIKYNITYTENLYTLTKSSYASKAEFVNDFYSDFFDWLVANINNIPELTFANGVYTIKMNSSANGTSTFANVQELKNLDMYKFEASLSSLIYKPVEGTNSASYVPVVDNAYFLNTEPYRSKYIEMNAYLLNAVNVGYPSYSKNFVPGSNDRVQIFFRFHQWAKGSNTAVFNTLPAKHIVKYIVGIQVTMPSTHLTYTIEDDFTLPIPTAAIEFYGWYLDHDCTGNAITKISKGSTGNLIIYAKWEEVDVPDVYSPVEYVLDGGENNSSNPTTYLEGISTTIYEPTKKGYNFLGWSTVQNSTNYVFSINEKQSGKITLYANWEYTTYVISYSLSGEQNWGIDPKFSGTPLTSIITDANSGFWNGGYTNHYFLYNKSNFDPATFSFRIGIGMDDSIGTYVVKRISLSGKTFDSSGLDYYVVISEQNATWAKTADFRSKVQEGQAVKFVGDPDTGNATVEFYDPSNVSGGTIANYVTSYTLNTLPIILPTPILEGHTFIGWCLKADLSDTPITSIASNTTGDLVLYPKFA